MNFKNSIMKELKNVKGAKMISKTEQMNIKGGMLYPCSHPCPPNSDCCDSNDRCGVLAPNRVCIVMI
jgi:hypothetical protein